MRSKSISKKALLASLMLGTISFACGDSDDESRREEQLGQNTIIVGRYVSTRCFKNKLATAAALGADRFSTAEFDLLPDSTGTVTFRNYTDVNCTAFDRDQIIAVENVKVEKMGDGSVMTLDQVGVIVDPRWYVPVASSSIGYHFDVDYADGSSGPYLVAPSGSELAEFFSNPAGQGVDFDKAD